MTEPASADISTRDVALRLRIDKTLPTPAYLQLRDQLAALIGDGAWPAGAALPSERDLAVALRLSRMTVRRAFGELEDDELVEPRHGSGTYVRPRRLEQTIDRVIGFTDEARHLGFRPGARVLEFGPVQADADVAQALRCAVGAQVLRIARLRTADDAPLSLQYAFLRPSLIGLTAADLERDGSLYRTLERRYGVVPQRARQTISARLPHRRERTLLDIGALDPVLALERTTFDPDDQPFEYVRSAYRGDRYRVALDLRAPEGS
jgi:GntR family transcriptional regulator